jgi:hypothetical protein
MHVRSFLASFKKDVEIRECTKKEKNCYNSTILARNGEYVIDTIFCARTQNFMKLSEKK